MSQNWLLWMAGNSGKGTKVCSAPCLVAASVIGLEPGRLVVGLRMGRRAGREVMFFFYFSVELILIPTAIHNTVFGHSNNFN